jgi:hypothetical protein
MRKSFGQMLRIGVANDGIALVRTSRWRAGCEVLAERSLDADDGLAAIAPALRELLAQVAPAGWPVSVVLSDELARIWQVTPPPACSRMADLEAAAALRFRALFGAAAAGWKIAADWHATDPFLASAVPEALLSVLVQAARDQRCHLVEIVPQFVAAMNQWRKLRRRGAWFGTVHGGVLTVAAFDGQRLAAVRSMAVPAGADCDWLESQVAREALRLGLARPERLQVCGDAPTAWASDAGRLKFDCNLFDAVHRKELSDAARLACTGSAS